MLSIEEYIARRKKEDRLDEYDLNQRTENLKTCVNYVFEYYNNYLNISEAEEKTALKEEKIDKYRQQLRDYDPDVRDWLCKIYDEHGKQINLNIGRILKQDEFFLLYDSEREFRSISYECYSQLIKKLPFLKDQTEMLFQFIKGHHRYISQRSYLAKFPFITEELNAWIDKTWAKYNVSVLAFAHDWVLSFCSDEDCWPASHRKKSQTSWQKYDYDYKQKSNLFNLDSLYRRMPKKSFTRGRKQEFEILMMYYWLHGIWEDDDGYWEEYLDKVLQSMT